MPVPRITKILADGSHPGGTDAAAFAAPPGSPAFFVRIKATPR